MLIPHMFQFGHLLISIVMVVISIWLSSVKITETCHYYSERSKKKKKYI